MKPIAYMDIAPMFEEHWTGIPVVSASLASRARLDRRIEWKFVFESILIENEIVDELLTLRRGDGHLGYLERRVLDGCVLNRTEAARSHALFPNMKALRNVFGREAVIYHDFSTLLTPQFHNRDTINHHANRFAGDVTSSQMHFCVSQSTAHDLINYFGVDERDVRVLPLGVDLDPAMLSSVLSMRDMSDVEPYICVLGTVEPRKNGRIIFEFLEKYPDFLSRYKIIFVGRDGWLDEKNRLMKRLEAIDRNAVSRVKFSGFLSESQKLSLLSMAKFVVYPSFFEGYGIPVAEAGVLGKYVVCSNTSSLPEVYPERSFFFDPADVHSFAAAIDAAELAANITFLDRLDFSEIWSDYETRSWGRTYECVANWIHEG
ncbi:glycosyltransferase [Paraburkholderia oxyphila]|uniref:glycosyltransferase n=1 Tax=Paraburkholderia oxyphila TaxID=614212 RepID=UPI0005BD18C8|nr:glycosyltransferase [Paraburkholderia oxyphila]